MGHVAAHSPACIPPLKSLPAATRSPLFSLSAVCLHAWVAPLTCALCSSGNCTICTFTRVSIDSPRQPFSESARWRASTELSASVRLAIGFSAATKRASDQDARPERSALGSGRGISPRALFTHKVKWNMLEICPPALCPHGLRLLRRWHSTGTPNSCRSCANWGGNSAWQRSVQCAAVPVRDRAAAPGPAWRRASGSATSHPQIATHLESCSCTNKRANSLESCSCGKSGGAPPPSIEAPLLRGADLSRIGSTARRFPAISGSDLGEIRAREAESTSPLEYALTEKWGWGVPVACGSFSP